jgi:hypothetical protein
MVLRRSSDPVSTLNLNIDTIQRLGISHRFEEKIDEQLDITKYHYFNFSIIYIYI